MKTQHSTEFPVLCHLASIKGESCILLPVVHRFIRFGIDGNNY